MAYIRRTRRTFRSRRRLTAARKIGRFVKRGWGLYKRNRSTVASLAKDVMMLRSLVNAEKKYIAFTESFNFGSNYNGTDGHYVQSLLSLAQGTTAATRTGNSVKGSSLQYSFNITPQANTTQRTDYQIYILMHPGVIFDDVYTTGVGGTLGTLFLDTDYNSLRTTRSLRNVEHFKDWIILKKIRGFLHADESSTAGNDARMHTGAVKLYKHHKFNGANTPCIENQLYYLFVSNAGNSGTAASGLTCTSQYRFHFIDN